MTSSDLNIQIVQKNTSSDCSLTHPLISSSIPEGSNRNSFGEITATVHQGGQRRYDHRSLTLPIYNSVVKVFNDTAELCAVKDEELLGSNYSYVYGRYGNPSVDVCEQRLAKLDSAEAGVLFTSGMGAVSGVLLPLLSAGDHVVIGEQCYRKTRALCNEVLKRFGINVTVVPIGDYSRLSEALLPQTKLIFFESPTNPYLRIVDLEKVVEIARRHNITTVVDATFATPINQKPIEFGVDLVIHSATKYLSGNNDLLAGVVVGQSKYIDIIREFRGTIGGIPCATDAVKLEQSIKTLALRVNQQNNNALQIATYLERNPFIERVWYPGLESHPDYSLAQKQLKGFGGVVSFEVRGDLNDTARLIDSVTLPKIANSLGGVETLIEQPALFSFYRLTTEERLAVGIKNNLVRFSIGIENVEDLLSDLDEAFLRAFPNSHSISNAPALQRAS